LSRHASVGVVSSIVAVIIAVVAAAMQSSQFNNFYRPKIAKLMLAY